MASHIEIDILREPVGKQDQYAAAFGGVNCYEFRPDDSVVVTPLGVRLCRPSETVLGLLSDAQRGAFTKEDGEAVVDAEGRRIVR